VSNLLAFVLYYHFALVYTRTGGQRRFLLSAYLLLAVVAALSPTNLIIKAMRIESYGYSPVVGPLAPPLLMFALLFMAGGAYCLLRRYRVSSSYEEKNRLLYLSISVLFPLLGMFLDALTDLPPAAIWGNMIFCAICSIAIIRYHLLDVRLVFRKSLVYLLMSALVALPYVGVLSLSNRFLASRVEPWWLQAFTLVVLALALQPLHSWAQQIVDRVFYRGRYDFLKALEDFILEVHSIRDLNHLSGSLVRLIARALQSTSVLLLLPSDLEQYDVIASIGANDFKLTLNRRGPLIRWMQVNKSILHYHELHIVPQLQSLTANDIDELKRIKAELFVPLMTKEKEVIGVLIVGQKLSHQPYSEEDERLLLAVVSRMAVELENAHLLATEGALRRELQEETKRKTEFLHNVAHELKTPLTAIIASSDVLEQQLSLTTAGKTNQLLRLARNISQSSLKMNDRVTELLDFARMQTAGLQVQFHPLNIESVITDVSSLLSIVFSNNEQSLKLEIADSLPQVMADRDRVEQILTNLLSNANKFSPKGSNITLRAQMADKKVTVEIMDSAPALSMEEMEKIFSPYYRGEDIGERGRIPGLGLGLSISKKLVELQHGEIWVKSEPARGNTFAFSLPVAAQNTDASELDKVQYLENRRKN
jgi:signal transduction histidine kinase